LWSVRRGVTRPARALAIAAVGLGVLLCVGGCGGSEGVGDGAAVSVYASQPLSGPEAAAGKAFCAAAGAELRRAGGRAGEVRLKLVCLDDTGGSGRWRLAAVGANARRASEDSTAVAYLGEPQAAPARFSLPILEAAGIGQLRGGSGTAAMAAVLRAVRDAGGTEDLRADVRSSLEAG
ncbi:MAG TPA: hypothetical protein VHA54_02490, partial [Solirubrobacterales bacterium]|nr:hypothetical protein [Solirubrobacterales bacterium]